MFSTFSVLLLSALTNGLYSLEQRDCGRLPFNIYGSSVVYDGKHSLYYVGGNPDGEHYRSFIYKFSINNSTFNPIPLAELPGTVMEGVAAIDKNGNIFHFGGVAESSKDIYRFNIHTLELELLQTKLNASRQLSSIVVVGDLVYIFSGDQFYDPFNCTIEEFNMVTKTSTIIGELDISFNQPYVGAVYDGKYVYIFRYGISGTSIPVLRFDPATKEQKVLRTPIPSIFSHSVAVDGNLAYKLHEEKEDHLMIYNTETDDYHYSRVSGRLVSNYNSRITYAKRQNTLMLSGVNSDYNSPGPKIICVDLPPKNFECTEGDDGLYPHPDCTKFIVCNNAQQYELDCPADLHFHPIELICDYPENANCTV